MIGMQSMMCQGKGRREKEKQIIIYKYVGHFDSQQPQSNMGSMIGESRESTESRHRNVNV